MFALVTRILQIAMGQNNSPTVDSMSWVKREWKMALQQSSMIRDQLSATLSCLDGGVNKSLSLSLSPYIRKFKIASEDQQTNEV